METKNEKTSNTTPPGSEDNLFILKTYIRKFFRDALDLEEGVDKRGTINEIKNKKSMSGANAWMLMCSIVIASVGLNMNSPAVIIGAMLISPLMSPILGIGLAVGINDKDTLKKSLAHFSMAVIIALVTSTIYFWLTPLGGITEQISDRTAPGPLDIFIAFFGGIAGIVSIARKDISTTLPGVAIATALMPPLCVTGFGIATWNMEIVFSSFFLFFINTVFVSFATYIIVHFLLKFPQKDFMDKTEKRKNNYYILGFLLVISVISYFPFSSLLEDRNNNNKVEQFIEEVIADQRKYLDDYRFTSSDGSNLLVLKVYGDSISMDKINEYQLGLERIGLRNTKIEIIPTTEITMDDLLEVDNKIKGMKDLTSQLDIVKSQKTETEQAIQVLQDKLNEYKIDSTSFNQLCQEIKVLQTDVSELTMARGRISDLDSINNDQSVVLIKWNNKTRDQLDREKYLQNYLKKRMQNDALKVVHYYFD
ncbi:MAG: TIGR00341 family protein [Saprospiraceae bacterium]|nr:TIGR00341 family protein [Saprospiraceae bacterium]